DQGAGSRRGEGGDRPVRLLRFGRDAGRHPRYRAQTAREEGLSLNFSLPVCGARAGRGNAALCVCCVSTSFATIVACSCASLTVTRLERTCLACLAEIHRRGPHVAR